MYSCRDCNFKGNKTRFNSHLTNEHQITGYFSTYTTDERVSVFCCGIPFSSKYRLEYHKYLNHSNKEQVGFGNNIRRCENVDEIPEFENAIDNVSVFCNNNYIYDESRVDNLNTYSYSLYTDEKIYDGSARESFILLLNKLLSKVSITSEISIDYSFNFCRYENLGGGNIIVTGQEMSKMLPLFIYSEVGNELQKDEVIRKFDNTVERIQMQGSGWVLNRLTRLNINVLPS